MRSDKKPPLKSDKKAAPKVQKKGTIGYNKKSALLEDAITQMNAGKYGRASAALKDLLALDPLNAEARRLFATLHLRLGSLMSARTAFESLAREAMERQDYWLAESLLREYLTAGPRCVPFLEMLGRVYEEKGDVMAAVAEYGKAVEVLLEDPDTDNPNRASDLFGRIRSIAPGSPVAFRFAAMFDTVTGQVLQAAPQPAAVESESEPSQAAGALDSSADNSSVVAMPWEQVESVSPAVPVEQKLSVPAVEDSTEAMDLVAPPSSVKAVTEAIRHDGPLDQTAATQAAASCAESEPQTDAGSALSPVASVAEPVQLADQSESPIVDPPPASPEQAEGSSSPVAEAAQPMITLLAQGSGHPIAEAPAIPAPMPWDQIEDAAVIPPAPDVQEPMIAEAVPAFSEEAEPPASPAADTASPPITVPAQTHSEPIAAAPPSPAAMPWDQVEDVATAIPPPLDTLVPVMAEVAPAFPAEQELSTVPVVESEAPTLQILTNAGHHPISEAPSSPAPMPWDQVEEATGAIPPAAEPNVEIEATDSGKTIEPDTTTSAVESLSTAEPTTTPVPSEITSSGLSWEEILAAVAAMQASPASSERLSSTGNTPSLDMISPEGTATPVPPVSDPVAAEPVLFEAQVPDHSLIHSSEAPSLSAPMPWEQIEIDDVTILRQEPEPEFGPVPSESSGSVQDATLILPVVAETVSAAGTPEENAGADCSVHMESAPTSDFRILASDDPIKTEKPPIHIPAHIPESADEPVQGTVTEPAQAAGSTIHQFAEYSLCLAESDSNATPVSDEPSSTPADPITEFAIAASDDVPPMNSQQMDEQDPETPVEASVAVCELRAVPQADEPESDISPHEVSIQAAATEVSAPPVAPPLFVEQPTQPADLVAPSAPEVLIEDAPPAPISMMSSRADEEPVSNSAAEVAEGAGFPLTESVVPLSEVFPSLVPSVPEELLPLPVMAVNEAPSEEPVVAPDEPAPVAERTPTAEGQEVCARASASVDLETNPPVDSSASMPSSSGGLHILWDGLSSAPPSSASTGNMLTRWLKKPAEVVPVEVVEASQPAMVPDEPSLPVAHPAAEEEEVASIATDRTIVQPGSSQSARKESTARQKPSNLVARRAWRGISLAVTSIIGAGVSTTRSIIVLIVALVSLVTALLAGGVGLVVVTWLMLEEQPNPAYQSMTSVPQLSLQDSQKNGYFLLLGFGAAPTQDPVQAGIDRRAEETDRAVTLTCLTGEGNGSGSHQGASAEVAGKWLKSLDPAAQMRMESTGVKAWVSQAGVAMGRYRQWLSKPFEDWGYGQQVSPNCGLVLYAHRLYVAEGFAQDVDAGIARLETDLTAWRTVFGQAKTMPIKMLAGDALNDDIAVVSGLLLRADLDEQFISRLAKLARPLDQTEQSIRWPMQSQFVLATTMLDDAVNHDPGGTRPLYGSLAAALPLPKQRRFNAYAQYYEAAGKAAAEGRYADLPKQSQFMRTSPYGLADVFVKPIESLVGIEPLPTWETFAGRVLETEARLRLASLQAWLRRTPPEQNLLTRIAKAGQGLYDPFTGYPMLVNMKKGVFYSVGRDMKDNEAQERLDIVAHIPPSALAGGKRPVDPSQTK